MQNVEKLHVPIRIFLQVEKSIFLNINLSRKHVNGYLRVFIISVSSIRIKFPNFEIMIENSKIFSLKKIW